MKTIIFLILASLISFTAVADKSNNKTLEGAVATFMSQTVGYANVVTECKKHKTKEADKLDNLYSKWLEKNKHITAASDEIFEQLKKEIPNFEQDYKKVNIKEYKALREVIDSDPHGFCSNFVRYFEVRGDSFEGHDKQGYDKLLQYIKNKK